MQTDRRWRDANAGVGERQLAASLGQAHCLIGVGLRVTESIGRDGCLLSLPLFGRLLAPQLKGGIHPGGVIQQTAQLTMLVGLLDELKALAQSRADLYAAIGIDAQYLGHGQLVGERRPTGAGDEQRL